MQKILWVCSAALLAVLVIGGGWTVTSKQKAANAVVAAPASIDPFDLMLKAIKLPVHIIEDVI